ncbi:MAG: DUF433 domain-containing protein [Rhodospirillales bacterium]|jgi:uncharacterized protein (DUF433 family)
MTYSSATSIEKASPHDILQAWQDGSIAARDAMRLLAVETLTELHAYCVSSAVAIQVVPAVPGSLEPWVVADPDVLSGVPCFRNTRIPVGVLFDNLADGLSIDEIVASYPSLDRADLVAVLQTISERSAARIAIVGEVK